MTNPNDPVHPTIIDLNPTGHLTKREYFAAMAMQGWIANKSREGTSTEYAVASLAAADALIAELNKEPKS